MANKPTDKELKQQAGKLEKKLTESKMSAKITNKEIEDWSKVFDAVSDFVSILRAVEFYI